jgi:methylmalonyl-CoA mutase cobalamin-binding domain/chain
MSELTLNEIRESNSKEPLDKLVKSLVIYDENLSKEAIYEIIANKTDPLIALARMTEVMRLIGDGFEKNELFLPDLLSASDTMKSVMPVLEEEIKKRGEKRDSIGKVVIGTVLGDIHSIGKTMVATLLSANGFEVIDIGIDIKSEKFIEAVKKNKADILAMSALLTTTAYEQKNVMAVLDKEGVRKKVKVIVGGGAITEEFANKIGADGYSATAPGAVKLCKDLLGK